MPYTLPVVALWVAAGYARGGPGTAKRERPPQSIEKWQGVY